VISGKNFRKKGGTKVKDNEKDNQNDFDEGKPVGSGGEGARTPSDKPELSVLKTIIGVANAIHQLKKTTENAHARYKYVPIDDFYREAAVICKARGLLWTIRETSCEHVGHTKTRGGDVPVFKYRYEFDMFTEAGMIKSYTSLSVLHPLQGPQTSGSALSYAEKMMMRTTFKIATGEEDADVVDPAVTNALQVHKTVEEWRSIAKDILAEASKKKVGDRAGLLSDHRLNLALMREQAPDIHKHVLDKLQAPVAGGDGRKPRTTTGDDLTF
jgi:hypothetical protein